MKSKTILFTGGRDVSVGRVVLAGLRINSGAKVFLVRGDCLT